MRRLAQSTARFEEKKGEGRIGREAQVPACLAGWNSRAVPSHGLCLRRPKLLRVAFAPWSMSPKKRSEIRTPSSLWVPKVSWLFFAFLKLKLKLKWNESNLYKLSQGARQCNWPEPWTTCKIRNKATRPTKDKAPDPSGGPQESPQKQARTSKHISN